MKTEMAESRTEDNTIDRLSSLPDSVLCHILSFLPTQTTVSTITLLSHRYLHLWKYLQVLDFKNYDKDFLFNPSKHPERLKSFAAFVNAVLALRESCHIRKISLSCPYTFFDKSYDESVDRWISTAIGPHLEELHLCIIPSCRREYYPPLSLFTCPKLVSLSLCSGILLPLKNSSTVQLPSLKLLTISVCYLDVNSLDALLSGCPNLETLYLSFIPLSFSNIRMPTSLKSLKFNAKHDIGACLEILDAPNLKYLEITQITFSSVGDLHNVHEAYLDVFSPPGQSDSVASLPKLLRALYGTEYLHLGPSTTKWLLGAPTLDFPKFGNLLVLKLVLPCFDSTFLFIVLHNCYKLQALMIENNKEPKPRRKKPRKRMPHPRSVPDCLVSHLTHVQFEGFDGFADEMGFAEYVLRKGLVLEIMIIIDASVRVKDHVLKKLSDVPRSSASADLQFHDT